MKRTIKIAALAVMAVMAFTGCELLAALLGGGPTPVSQVEGFIGAANADPQSPEAMQAFFDATASGYSSMTNASYWDGTAFRAAFQPFAVAGLAEAGAATGLANSVVVTGTITGNSITTAVPVEFVLVTDPNAEIPTPLIVSVSFPPAPTLESSVDVIEAFADAASTFPQVPATLQSFFDPAAADYGSMGLQTYWDLRYFNDDDGPYTIVSPTAGTADSEFPGSITINAGVTNLVNPTTGYPGVFIMTNSQVDPYAGTKIRKITVTVDTTDEIIEQVFGR